MFRFRLQRVLDLRAQTEQKAAGALADARVKAQQARGDKQALEDRLAQGFARIAGGDDGPRSVGEMRNRCLVVDQLGRRVVRAGEEVAQADAAVRKTTDDFTAAFRDRRVLDRLRERRLGEWRAEETRTDLVRMDGVALARFVRPGEKGE
jgi:flagellar FliJ protein